MRDYSFQARIEEDDDIIRVLEAKSADEREDFIRKALKDYIKEHKLYGTKTIRKDQGQVRPEPHGYPVE